MNGTDRHCVISSSHHPPVDDEPASTLSLRRLPQRGLGKRRTLEEILDAAGESRLLLL